MSDLSRTGALLDLARPYRLHLVGMVVVGVLDQVLAIAGAAVGAWLVGAVVTGAQVDELRTGLVVLGALVLPRAVTGWVESYWAHDMAFRVLVDVRERLYTAFDRLAPALLSGRRTGDLASTAMDDVERLEVFFAHTLGPLVVAVVVPAGSLAALAWIDPALAIVLLPFTLLVASTPAWLRRRAATHGRELRVGLGLVNADAVDGVQGMREIVAFGAQDRFLGQMDARTIQLRRSQLAHGGRMGMERAATDSLVALGVLVVLATCAHLVSSAQLSPALYPTAVVLAAAALAPVAKLSDAAREIGIVRAASDRVQALVQAPPAVRDVGTTTLAPHVLRTLSYRDISYRYAPSPPDAVSGVSFDVDAGETVALVGHSGAGKSTLAQLLLRFDDVHAGSVRLGGVDVRDLPLDVLRAEVAYVPQHVHLLNTSVFDNIALACPHASRSEVEDAARTALAHDFIVEDLPDGYDTVVGEWGTKLSGGQRQRIAIARALLRDAPVLVMDEPVSNLDALNEQLLQAAMTSAREGRTTLLVAHRLSTIRTADRLIVLDRGRVAEVGTHEELLGRGGTYSRLVRHQSAASGPLHPISDEGRR